MSARGELYWILALYKKKSISHTILKQSSNIFQVSRKCANLQEWGILFTYEVRQKINETDFVFIKVFFFSNINVIPIKIFPLGSYAPMEMLFPLRVVVLEIFNRYGL